MHISYVCVHICMFIFYPLAASFTLPFTYLHKYMYVGMYIAVCVCICIILRRTFWLKYFNNGFLCAAAGSKDIVVIRPLAVAALTLSLSLSHIPTLCSLLSQCFICWPISCPFFRMILTKAKLANTCVHKYEYMCVCVNMYRCACVHSMYLRMCKRLVRRR